MSQTNCDCGCDRPIVTLPLKGIDLTFDASALPSGIQPGPNGTHLVSRNGELVWEPLSTSASTGVPLLSLIWELCTTPLPGKLNLSLDNGLLSRSDWAAAWAEIQATRADLIIDDAAWLEEVAANGSCAKFSGGDGSATFRVPLLRGVAASAPDTAAGATTGAYLPDQLQGHSFGTGLYPNAVMRYIYNRYGNVTGGNTAMFPDRSSPTSTGGGGSQHLKIVADELGNGTPRVGSETRGKRVVLTPYMQMQ